MEPGSRFELSDDPVFRVVERISILLAAFELGLLFGWWLTHT